MLMVLFMLLLFSKKKDHIQNYLKQLANNSSLLPAQTNLGLNLIYIMAAYDLRQLPVYPHPLIYMFWYTQNFKKPIIIDNLFHGK